MPRRLSRSSLSQFRELEGRDVLLRRATDSNDYGLSTPDLAHPRTDAAERAYE